MPNIGTIISTTILLVTFTVSCTYQDDKVGVLTEKISVLEDSLSRLERRYFVFNTINTVSFPVEQNEDSITYQLLIAADYMLVNGSFVELEVKETENYNGRFFKKGGYHYVTYPTDKLHQLDTLKLLYEFRRKSKPYIELIEEIQLDY